MRVLESAHLARLKLFLPGLTGSESGTERQVRLTSQVEFALHSHRLPRSLTLSSNQVRDPVQRGLL